MNYGTENFGPMNGNMAQNGMKSGSQPDAGYSPGHMGVQQYQVPQSTNVTTPQDPTTTTQPETREPSSLMGSTTKAPFTKNMWRYGTKYEVKDEETFAFYDGYVVDYNVADKKVQIAYEDDWKVPMWVDVTYIRPTPKPFDPQEWQPKDGDHIECMAKAEEYEPTGWWGCRLACFQDGHYLINFDGWDDSHNEILGKEMLRPYGGDPPFEIDAPFMTTLFPLDKKMAGDRRDEELERKLRELRIDEDELNDRIFKWAESMPREFEYIRQRSKLLHLGYYPSRRNCLSLIGVSAAIQTATLALRYLLTLQKRWIANEEGQQKRHARTQEDIDKYGNATRLEVPFPPFLTQFLIGRNGSNISAIKNEIGDELMDLKVMEDGKCLIIAETPEAAERTREKVEMVVKYVCVPRSTVREIIGRGGETIKQLEQDSGVTFIQTEDRFKKWYANQFTDAPQMPPKDENTEVIMVIVGPRSDVDTCAHLLQMKVDYALKMEDARGRNKAAKQEWANLNGDKPRYRQEDDDDDEYPEPGDVRYGGRPMSGGRRRGNRQYRRTRNEDTEDGGSGTRAGGMDEAEDGDGPDIYEYPEAEELGGGQYDDEDGGDGYRPSYRGKQMKYVVKGSTESKGQSEETGDE